MPAFLPPLGPALWGCALFLGWETAVGAEVAMVGDPQHPGALVAALAQAHDRGAREIAIAPGVYDLPAQKDRDTLLLDHWRDTTIHATGATLIFEVPDPDQQPVHLNSCTHVTWDGGTLLFVHPSATQGRITEVGTDAKGPYCDWRIDAGYPTGVDPGKTTYDFVDQKTRVLKVNTQDWTPTSSDPTGPGLFRLHYAPENGAWFAVNDWLVTRAPGGDTLMHLDGCEACTVENVTLENAGFAALFETGGAGGNHYLRCRIQPGPRPPGATEDQLVGCGADGFHSTEMATGPDIEGCVFTGVFLDDCIAIHGTFDRVIGAEGRTITLASARPLFQSGDPVRIADMHGFFAQATCVKAEQGPGSTVKLTLDRVWQIPIDHSEDSDDGKGTKASDPAYGGRGYKIVRCRLGDTRSRGILVKADQGLIEGCTIAGCGMSGISIGPEFWWNEAGYCRDVTVSGNKFINCNKNNGEQAALWIHGDGAIGNCHLLLKDNSFEECYGQSIIRSDWADGVDITGNRIAKSFEVETGYPNHVLWLMDCRHVKLLGNRVAGQGPFAGDLVGLASGMSSSEVENDNPTGIAVSPLSP